MNYVHWYLVGSLLVSKAIIAGLLLDRLRLKRKLATAIAALKRQESA